MKRSLQDSMHEHVVEGSGLKGTTPAESKENLIDYSRRNRENSPNVDESEPTSSSESNSAALPAAWLGSAMASAASRGQFTLQLVSPTRNVWDRHREKAQKPQLVVKSNDSSRSAAGSEADVSLTLTYALAAASQRRSKVMELEKKLKELEANSKHISQPATLLTDTASWRSTIYATSRPLEASHQACSHHSHGPRQAPIQTHGHVRTLGNDAYSVSSVDHVLSDDSHSVRDATMRASVLHDHFASHRRPAKLESAVQTDTELQDSGTQTTLGEQWGSSGSDINREREKQALETYEELISELHGEMEGMKVHMKGLEGELSRARERAEEGKKDAAKARVEARSLVERLQILERENGELKTALAMAAEARDGALKEEKEAKYTQQELRKRFLDVTGIDAGGAERSITKELHGQDVQEASRRTTSLSECKENILMSSGGAAGQMLIRSPPGKPVGASLAELDRLRNRCRSLEEESKRLSRRIVQLEQDKAHLSKVSMQAHKSADMSVRSNTHTLAGMEKRMEGLRRQNSEMAAQKQQQSQYVVQLERGIAKLLAEQNHDKTAREEAPWSRSRDERKGSIEKGLSVSRDASPSEPRESKRVPSPHEQPRHPSLMVKAHGRIELTQGLAKSRAQQGARNSLREAEQRLKVSAPSLSAQAHARPSSAPTHLIATASDTCRPAKPQSPPKSHAKSCKSPIKAQQIKEKSPRLPSQPQVSEVRLQDDTSSSSSSSLLSSASSTPTALKKMMHSGEGVKPDSTSPLSQEPEDAKLFMKDAGSPTRHSASSSPRRRSPTERNKRPGVSRSSPSQGAHLYTGSVRPLKSLKRSKESPPKGMSDGICITKGSPNSPPTPVPRQIRGVISTLRGATGF